MCTVLRLLLVSVPTFPGDVDLAAGWGVEKASAGLMGATAQEVLALRSACCVGTGIRNGDARSLVPRPQTADPLSLLLALLMMEA